MEDPITGDDAVRSAVAEEEAEAVASGLGKAFLEPPAVELRHDVARLSTLIIAEGPAAAMLCECCLPDKEEVGSVKLAEIPAAEGSLRRSELDANTAIIYKLALPAAPGSGSTGNGAAAKGGVPGGNNSGSAPAAGGGMLLVSCSRPVHPERAWAWTQAVLDALQPRQTLMVLTMPANQYRGGGDAANDVLVFAVPSSAATAQHAPQPTAADGAAGSSTSRPAGGGGVPLPLPSGTLLSGVAAAVISYCQMRQQPATALAGVQMGAVPDAALLQGLARAVGRLLAGGAAAGGEAVWRADAAALRAAGLRADRAYRAAFTSSLYT